LLVLMVVLLFKVHMIHRSGRLGEGRGGSNSWLSRYRKAIYAVSMLAPLAIAVLISFGYEYMTFAAMSRLEWTLLALIVITVLQAIATRALLVRRRRLTIEQYRQRRASQGESELVDTVGIDLASPEVDLGSVSHQAQQLVRLLTMSAVIASLALIWDDLLPGLRMLDRVTLWSTGTTTVNPVTLRDLLFALLSIAVTVYAAKSLPALIEMFFLQPLSPGARYAVSTIFRYVIGALGFVFGLSFLSIPWSQLSWIVAAASVGLGFGLQEILANFVSGIILLLEQPIRVGDIVTVDGSTGVVSKMQIRATTVTNWDRQELVIPNKDLVTGKLLNWTLSNVINRVVINVGVAYGSDANQVRDVLGGVVCGHPEVLEDPAPLVTFEQFGDSSLNFVVRCYLPSLEKRLSTVHELHTGIADALKAAGIEIPFPQRDIHMTIEPSGTAIDGSDRALGRVAP
jgi:potassium efflux system protein